MNDLAEKALHGLHAAGRHVSTRPVPWLAAAGFVAGAAVVVTGGRIGAAPAAVPLDRWLGLLAPAGYLVTGVGTGAVMLAAIGVLLALWVFTAHLFRVRSLPERAAWVVAGGWAAPFVIGPPLLSTDIYRAVAQGLLARQGLSGYRNGATALGPARLVDAIDPDWRSARSTDGPLASLLDHLAVSVTGGSAIATVVVLRVVGVLAAVALGRLAATLAAGAPAGPAATDPAVTDPAATAPAGQGPAAGARRAQAVCLTAGNPAVLLFVVSAGLDAGILVALLLGCVVAARQGRWWLAVILSCVAAGLRPVALVAVVPVLAAHAYRTERAARAVVLARDAVLAAGTLALAVLSVPFGLGWLANLSASLRTTTPFAPATVLGDAIGAVVRSASYDDLIAGARVAAAVAAATAIGYLYVTARLRPLEQTIGFALVAAGVLAPVVYPAFLLWGVLCLAPAAAGARRDWVLALSAVACVLAPAGLGDRGGQYATALALVAIGALVLPRLYLRHRRAALLTARPGADG